MSNNAYLYLFLLKIIIVPYNLRYFELFVVLFYRNHLRDSRVPKMKRINVCTKIFIVTSYISSIVPTISIIVLFFFTLRSYILFSLVYCRL